MQFDVQFYLRLFDIREMLLTARVLAKASRFTIANGLRRDYAQHLLPASQKGRHLPKLPLSYEQLMSAGGWDTYCRSRRLL